MSVNSAAADAAGDVERRAARWWARMRDRAVVTLAAERDRLFLWLPVFLGAGIIGYFSLPYEPPSVFGWCFAALCTALCVAMRRQPAWALVCVACLATTLGFLAGQVRTAWVAAPRLAAPLGPVTVTGMVTSVEPSGSAWRVLVSDPSIVGLTSDRTPHRLRVSVRGIPPEPGDRVRLRARLLPPPTPAVPGGFDFQRQSWFAGLGAVGYALGRVEILAPRAEGGFAEAVASVRHGIDRRILAVLDGDRGSLANALVTGLRGGVSEETIAAMRDSGLAHLLAISGLHMSLVAGFVFFVVRAGLAAIPSLALRWQTRKLAAVVALLFAGGYLLLSGATVPTQRAFVMLTLALAAILADRLEMSMRPIAFAALIVLVLTPEAVLGPSFQLSFAAVVTLVAAYEALKRRRERRAAAGLPPASRWLSYPGGLIFTSVVAAVATAPFAAYHFNQAALYSVAANLVAVPVTGLWVMPCGIVALLAMPISLEALPLRAMAVGLDVITWVARETASWPGSALRGVIMPPSGMAAVAVGGLWLCLWRTGWRLAGLPAVVAGLAMASLAAPPDILLSQDGRLVAVRDADTLLLTSLRAAGFERENWMRQTGADVAEAWPEHASESGAMRCDITACLYRRSGRTVAFIRHEDAMDTDCANADLVVLLAPISSRLANRRCNGPRLLRHRDLRSEGAHAIWLSPAGVTVETVRGRRGDRPWTKAGQAGDPDASADDQ